MFVTLDGEDIAWRVFRRVQNVINFEGRETRITEVIKNTHYNTFKRNIPQKILNFSIPDSTLLISFSILRRRLS